MDQTTFDRWAMIDTIVDNMEQWLKTDAYSFWDHIRELERDYLRKMNDQDLTDVYEDSV